MEPISYQLLDALPCGAVLLRGGVPEAFNAAAGRMLPCLKEGRLPETLKSFLDECPGGEKGSGSCAAEGREFRMTLSREAEGLRLLSLTRLANDGPPVSMRELSAQLRQCLGDLRLAVDALAPTLKEKGGKGAERDFSVLNQSFYRLLRMTGHMELAGELGEKAPEAEALDLADLCAELVDETDLLAGQAGVRLTYDSRLLTLPTTGSRELLRIMLLNLLSNAIKAAGRGGTVELRLARKEGRALLTVADSGRCPVDLMELFSGESAGMKAGGGLGLGLTLARQIALLHEGTILAVRSGEETRVTVSLPQDRLKMRTGLHTPFRDNTGGFSSALVELADALPSQVFDFSETES